ncbi:MAG TPA: hypothetical protein VGM74_17170 [Burkholderiaceae bacterium]
MSTAALRAPLVAAALTLASLGAAAQPDCGAAASPECFFAFTLPGAPGQVPRGQMHYYASRVPEAPGHGAAPTSVLIALHGHSRDANKTFDAALLAARRAGTLEHTLIVAPLFQVAARAAAKCETAGVPPAQPGDLLWSCGSWAAGAEADGGRGPGSFAAMDALVGELLQQWPSLHAVTIAGFSAGAQFTQRYVGFAAPPPAGVSLRYVVADPGSWLYFDAARVLPVGASRCPAVNRWKYGTEGLPATLGADAAQARARYAEADISYLEGELDDSDARGTAYRVLDKSCAANAQGLFRLQRGEAYAAYDRKSLAPAKRRQVAIAPGCAHDVACVFPSDPGRAALFGPP